MMVLSLGRRTGDLPGKEAQAEILSGIIEGAGRTHGRFEVIRVSGGVLRVGKNGGMDPVVGSLGQMMMKMQGPTPDIAEAESQKKQKRGHAFHSRSGYHIVLQM
jgi:hypothetical protein